jgi:branched-chain amino acid transport system substrate-binding protein
VQIDSAGAEVPVAAGGTPVSPKGDGSATCAATTTIAMAGPLTGSSAALGINILDGAKVAIDQHNKANPNCQVVLKEFDTEGDPQKATQVAPNIVSDPNIIALLGPAFSGETKATGAIFNQAGLLSLTASATNVALTTNGWTNFFRGLANDGVQGPAVASYMLNTLKYKKVCVVQDNSDYGVGLAEVVTTTLGSVADSNCAAKVKKDDKDFSATVQLVKGESPDAIFYAGYYPEAAPFVQQLRDAGVTSTFVSADGTNDPQFVAQAGESSKDAILSCPCGPAPDAYATEYQDFNGQAPGVYSTEGFDLTTIMLTGIDSGITDRAAMVNYVKNYDGTGLARQYKWDATGELSSSLIWIYKVQ